MSQSQAFLPPEGSYQEEEQDTRVLYPYSETPTSYNEYYAVKECIIMDFLPGIILALEKQQIGSLAISSLRL